MPLLLDTHAFIWFINGDKQLSDKARLAIENDISYVSIASLWEIAVKVSLKKLELTTPYEDILEQIAINNFQILPISFEDTVKVSQLEFHHRDPFDRILIAQSLNNQLSIITKDNNFHLYNVRITW